MKYKDWYGKDIHVGMKNYFNRYEVVSIKRKYELSNLSFGYNRDMHCFVNYDLFIVELYENGETKYHTSCLMIL